MNRLITAGGLALFACANGAFAQSSVTLYGIVDAGFVRQNDPIGGGKGLSQMTGGGQSSSRFGLRGSEDLGNGLKAVFNLEAGFGLDTGTSTLGALFGRIAEMGVVSRFGTVKMGRQLTPFYQNAILPADAFSMGLMGYIGNLFSTYPRVNNSVSYASPRWHGLTASVMYAFGEVVGNSAASRSYNGALNYSEGPVRIALAYYNQNNSTDTSTNHSVALSGSYNTGPVILYSAFQAIRSTQNGVPGITKTDTDVDAYSAGIKVPLGPHTLIGSVGHARDQRDIAGANAKATLYAIGYTYELSKRTNFYTSLGIINNRNGAAYSVADATTPAYGQKGFDIGIRHRF